MPIKTVYTAQIDHLQILDENGVLDEKLAKDTLSDDQVRYLYEFMITCRTLDEVADAGPGFQEGHTVQARRI